MNGLTVVIPSRNADNIRACVDSIVKHDASVTILAVEDFSLYSAPIPMQTRYGIPGFGDLGKIPGTKILGAFPFCFSTNCNRGIREAGSDDVILLNDDALLESYDGFTLMQCEAEAHPEYGIIGATTNLTGQPLQWTADRHPGVSPGLREVPWFAFICVLIPRRTIERVGLLDERYCLDYGAEDRDYCQMVRAAGLKCGVYDYCFVDHSKLTSTYRGSPTGQRSSAKNKALYHEKWPGVEF